jgi:hypothetical protein
LAATPAVSAIPAFGQVLGLSRGPASGTLVGETARCGLRSGARIFVPISPRFAETRSKRSPRAGTTNPCEGRVARCLEFGVAGLVDSFEQLDDIGSVAEPNQNLGREVHGPDDSTNCRRHVPQGPGSGFPVAEVKDCS